MHIAIVIPVYKQQLTADESLSLQQGLRVLHRYDIFLVCPDTLSTTNYHQTAGCQLHEKHFDSNYFDGIGGYNLLMESYQFYKAFEDYDYILIYQLDAWVFTDQLEQWCQRGYDYIGAPWFQDFQNHEKGYALWCVGNGGLSLRRVSKFLSITRRPYSRLKSPREVFRDEYHSLGDLGHCLVRCMGPYIGTNSIHHLMRHSWMWEDAFFCISLADTRFRLNLPTTEEAAHFAFEQSPQYLYDTITHGQLPFGCHAWRKHQYEEFWKSFINARQSDATGT